MKRTLLITILFSGIFIPAVAQNICVGDVILLTQAEVDNFNCTEVTGTLVIRGEGITDLSNLSTLERVGEDFTIEFTKIKNLVGLENLEFIGCSIQLQGNGELENTNALSSLEYLNNNIIIRNNRSLTSISGFEKILWVDHLIISDNPLLYDCCVLNHLVNNGGIRKSIDIKNNSPECAVSTIQSCAACIGNVVINTQEEADNFDCGVIEGNLIISSEEPLDLSALSVLTSVSGNVTIRSGDNFSLAGFENLASIGGTLSFSHINRNIDHLNLDPAETDISLLTSLTTIGGLSVYRYTLNGLFPVLQGSMKKLVIDAAGTISDSTWLRSITTIDTIRLLNGYAYQQEIYEPYLFKATNDGVVEISGAKMNNLNGLRGVSRLKQLKLLYLDLQSFDGLSDLIHIDDFYLSDIFVHGSCCGLYNFLKNGNDPSKYFFFFVTCSEEEILATCGPPEINCQEDIFITTQSEADAFNCPIIEGDLTIRSAVPINLDSMYTLYRVTGNMYLRVEEGFSLHGLENLRRIDGVLSFSPSYDELTTISRVDLSEFEGLRSVRGLKVGLTTLDNNFPMLWPYFETLHIDYLGEFTSSHAPFLWYIDSLKLTSVFYDVDPFLSVLSSGGYLEIGSSNVTDFRELRGIKYMQAIKLYQLHPNSNRTLVGFTDLERVDEFVMEEVEVSDCCGLYNLLQNGSVGKLIFEDNSCTVEDILSSCVTQPEVDEMTIFPNPTTSNVINIEWHANKDQASVVEILDNSGKVMHEIQVNPGLSSQHLELDISGIPKGIYLVRILMEDQVQLKRMVIK